MKLVYWIGLAPSLLLGCGGSSRYLLLATTHQEALAQPSYTPLPAVAEDRAAPVELNRSRLRPESAELADGGYVRVRPRRPLGEIITGSICLGIGVAFMTAGIVPIVRPVPPGARDEGGIAYATELGLGSAHALVGGVLLIVGGVRWSPEVR